MGRIVPRSGGCSSRKCFEGEECRLFPTREVQTKEWHMRLVIGMTSYQLYDDYPAETRPLAR